MLEVEEDLDGDEGYSTGGDSTSGDESCTRGYVPIYELDGAHAPSEAIYGDMCDTPCGDEITQKTIEELDVWISEIDSMSYLSDDCSLVVVEGRSVDVKSHYEC